MSKIKVGIISFLACYATLFMQPLHAYPVSCHISKKHYGTGVKMFTEFKNNARQTTLFMTKKYVLEATIPIGSEFWLAVLNDGEIIGYLQHDDVNIFCIYCDLANKHYGSEVKLYTQFDRNSPQKRLILTRKHVLRPRYFHRSNLIYWLAVIEDGVTIGYLDRNDLVIGCGGF